MGCSQKSLSTDEKKKKEVKAIQSEIKKNTQGTNNERKENRLNLEQKKLINIELEQNEETRIKKNEERLRNHWNHFNHSNF